MQIVSVEGRLVRDPVTRRVVDTAGIDVDPSDPYWARMLADGDVAPAPETPPAKPGRGTAPNPQET